MTSHENKGVEFGAVFAIIMLCLTGIVFLILVVPNYVKYIRYRQRKKKERMEEGIELGDLDYEEMERIKREKVVQDLHNKRQTELAHERQIELAQDQYGYRPAENYIGSETFQNIVPDSEL